jgi:glycosyltransferase involved in cell wall biosynthesis
VAVPRVGLGLFVYNGERYLTEAVDSLLAQTMGDFVLDISDNASTDGTEEICRAYAASDPRVRYIRQPENRGAIWNCNFAMGISPDTELYKACAHDDVYAPTYVERCLEELDRRPEIVACHSRTLYINEQSQEIMRSFRRQAFTDARPWVRFQQILLRTHDYSNVFALTRRSVMARVRPFQQVFNCDGVFLSELAFQGPFGEVPEHLFANRMHAKRATAVTTSGREAQMWANWLGASSRLPLWRTANELRHAIERAGLDPVTRVRCASVLGRWLIQRWKGFSWELATGLPLALGDRVGAGRRGAARP